MITNQNPGIKIHLCAMKSQEQGGVTIQTAEVLYSTAHNLNISQKWETPFRAKPSFEVGGASNNQGKQNPHTQRPCIGWHMTVSRSGCCAHSPFGRTLHQNLGVNTCHSHLSTKSYVNRNDTNNTCKTLITYLKPRR